MADPVFGHASRLLPRRQIVSSIRGAWDPKPNPFEGGRQPLQGRRLAPTLLDQRNNPEATEWDIVTITFPLSPAYDVASRKRRLVVNLVAPPPVDNPPFTRRGIPILDEILQAWRPAPPAPILKNKNVVQLEPEPQVDDPPFAAPGLEASLHAAWLQPWSMPQQTKYLLQETAEAVDEPSYGLKPWLTTILDQWRISWPAQRVRPLPEAFFEQVDDPPFSGLDLRSTILRAWQPPPSAPQTAKLFVQEETPPVVDDPPFSGRDVRSTVLSAWQPAPPQPQVAKPFVQVETPAAVDEPESFSWYQVVIDVPESPAYRPHTLRHLLIQEGEPPVPPQVDEPPYGLRPWLTTVLKTWEVTWSAQNRPKLIQEFIPPPVNEPPYGSRPWLMGVIRAWQPDPPPPHQRRPYQVFPLDEPPGFGWMAVEVNWPHSNAYWMPKRYLVQPFIPPDEPPYGLRPWLNTVLKSWEVTWPAQSRPKPIQEFIPPPVNDPPFGVRPWLALVRNAWEPPPPAPAQRPIRVTESGPVVVPPDDDDDERRRRWDAFAPWLQAADRETLQRQLDIIAADDAEILMVIEGLKPLLLRLKRRQKRTLH